MLFTTLYGITSRYDEQYPCSAVEPGANVDERLSERLGAVPGLRANDGVVPVHSQVWGDIAWAGAGDHLDVLGHFPETPRGPRTALWTRFLDRMRPSEAAPKEVVVERAAEGGGLAPEPGADTVHVDWLASGAGFDEAAFAAVMDAVAKGMLTSAV